MERRWLEPLVLTGLLGLWMSVGGCSKRSASAQAGKNSSVLRCAVRTNLVTLDPVQIQDFNTDNILKNVYGGLVELDENNQPVEGIVRQWQISSDGRTYTFYIQKRAKFNNGHEVTASDVKWSLERASHAELSGPDASGVLNDIVGFEKIAQHQSEELEGVKVIDKHTLEIKIKKPSANFLSKLSLPAAAILSKDRVPFQRPILTVKEMVGVGPYIVKKMDSDQRIVLVPNPYYYKGRPSLSKIEILVIKSFLSALSMYKSGKLDIIYVPSKEVSTLINDYKLSENLYGHSGAYIYWLLLNAKVYSPFSDQRVRQAFAMAIDRQSVVDCLFKEHMKVTQSILPAGVLGHRKNPNGIQYDILKARKLLAEAGYADASVLPPLYLPLVDRHSDRNAISENLVMQIRKAFPGIRVHLMPFVWDTYLEKLKNKELPIRLGCWAADYADPSNFLSDLFTSTSKINSIQFSNHKFDQLCIKADALSNAAEREKLYQKAEDLLLQDGSVIPLFFPKEYYLVQSKVRYLKSNLMGLLPLRDVEVLP